MQYVFLIISLLFFVFLLRISSFKNDEKKQHKPKTQKTQTQTPTITVVGRLKSRAKQTNKIRFYGLYDWFY